MDASLSTGWCNRDTVPDALRRFLLIVVQSAASTLFRTLAAPHCGGYHALATGQHMLGTVGTGLRLAAEVLR